MEKKMCVCERERDENQNGGKRREMKESRAITRKQENGQRGTME